MVRSARTKSPRTATHSPCSSSGTRADRSSANVWKEQLPFLEGVKAGSVVQVIGAVESYQGRRQLKITAPLRVVAGVGGEPRRVPSARERRHGEAVGDDRQVARRECARRNFARRSTSFSQTMPFARGSSAHRARRADTTRRSAGCSCTCVEVGSIARASAKAMRGDVDLVTAGALLHDIGKVETYSISAAGFDFTQAGSCSSTSCSAR